MMKKMVKSLIFKEALISIFQSRNIFELKTEEDLYKPFLFILNLLDAVFNKVIYEPHRENLFAAIQFEMTTGVSALCFNDLTIKTKGIHQVY
jgi:hypothetical protein